MFLRFQTNIFPERKNISDMYHKNRCKSKYFNPIWGSGLNFPIARLWPTNPNQADSNCRSQSENSPIMKGAGNVPEFLFADRIYLC
ncbi:MAG: hypothetical protein B6245_11930 [Desulfobacteraceae bacterium 4572_88]|nr:MAG: hypothetical protein B6245_11930 [Desulfobacteraceae bacterium 4572_88]